MAKLPRIGGSFAPPITPEKLTEYKDLAETASPQVNEVMMKLCRMIEVFQETPSSTNGGTPHPSGRGIIIPLEDAEVKRIWDVVPWKDECQMYAVLFESIDADKSRRNSEKLSTWQQSVVTTIASHYFPSLPQMKDAAAFLKACEGVEFLLTDSQKRVNAELTEKFKQCYVETSNALKLKKLDGVPYPVVEPTPLRDAAFHLLWFAVELCNDREPITADKL